MQTVALGTLVTLQAHNALWTALVLAAGFIPMGLLAPIGGLLADRLDRRTFLILTTLAEAAFAGLLAGLVAIHRDPPSLLVLLAFLGGSAGAIGFPSYQSMLPDLVRREHLLAAVSLSSAQWNMGRVLGPAIAGIVLVTWNPAAAFAINAISFGAVVIALVFVHLPHRERVRDGEGVLTRLVGGARVAAREPGCRSAIIMISVVGLIGSPFIGLISVVAIDGLHRKAGGPAILTTAQGIGAVVGALALAPLAKRIGQGRIVIISLFSLTVAIILYGLAPNIWLAALGILLVGGTYIGVLSGMNTVVQLRAPEAARGRVLSLYMMALGTIYPIGLIIEGALGQAIGVRLMTVISGIVLAVVLGGILWLSPSTFHGLIEASGEQPADTMVAEVGEIDLAGDQTEA